MGNYEQLIRIILFTLGGWVFGDAIANSSEFQVAVGGVISIFTFTWWAIRNKQLK